MIVNKTYFVWNNEEATSKTGEMGSSANCSTVGRIVNLTIVITVIIIVTV